MLDKDPTAIMSCTYRRIEDGLCNQYGDGVLWIWMGERPPHHHPRDETISRRTARMLATCAVAPPRARPSPDEPSHMRHFYATAADLLPVFARVESKRALRYTLTGHADSISIKSFQSGAELPTLYQPAPSASAIGCPAYLVTLAGTDVVARETSTIQGPTRWAIDQLVNPDTTTLSHGGIYRDDILLYGRVATASKSKTALALQRLFESALKKQFVRVKAFYLGPEAEFMLDKGARLTIGADSPTEYDLTR